MDTNPKRRIFVKKSTIIGSGFLLALCYILFELLTIPTLAKEPPKPTIKNPTHILQLMQSQNTKSIDIPVKLFKKNNKRFLANVMPDGQRMESEYIITKDNTLKFQWVAIKREGLLAIQFIGDKNDQDTYLGSFTALVDGQLRKDMSGQFKLKPLKKRK